MQIKFNNVTEADEILRRYFVINSFDGLLVVRIIMGTYVGGMRYARALISAGVAMDVSGLKMAVIGIATAVLSYIFSGI